MVPLEVKYEYINSLPTSGKIKTFQCLISNESMYSNKEEFDELTEVIYGMIESIQLNQSENFLKYYERKSNSQPSKDSRAPFIYDDFFIFTVLVGVSKFNIEKTWINKILNIRNENNRTSTFKNLIDGNFINTNNEYAIVYCFLKLIQPTEITNDFANKAFRQINQNVNLFKEQDDFKIICSIQAYENIILDKETPPGSEVFLLKQFNENFQKRISITNWFIRSIIWTLLFGLIILVLLRIEFSNRFLEEFSIATRIIAIIGMGQLTNFTPILKSISEKLTLKLYGYPEELRKK